MDMDIDAIIARGSTTALRFSLGCSTHDIAAVDISLINGPTRISWDRESCTIGETCISVKLTQEQSLSLSAKDRCYIQIRIRFDTTDVSVSRIVTAKVLPWIGSEEEL